MIAVSHSRAASAEPQHLTFAAFLKPIILPVRLHPFPDPDIINRLIEDIAHFTLKPPASHHCPVWLDSEMAVAAMAAVIYRVGVIILRDLEYALFIKIEGP